jgi:hypothetical protein
MMNRVGEQSYVLKLVRRRMDTTAVAIRHVQQVLEMKINLQIVMHALVRVGLHSQ